MRKQPSAAAPGAGAAVQVRLGREEDDDLADRADELHLLARVERRVEELAVAAGRRPAPVALRAREVLHARRAHHDVP